MKYSCHVSKVRSTKTAFVAFILVLFLAPSLIAQNSNDERPIPILTGNAGYFTNVDRGQTQLAPEITPVLLVPLGDRWLVEARAAFEGEFERENGSGPYKGVVGKDIDYLQVDYIVNPYVTVTAGRTPRRPPCANGCSRTLPKPTSATCGG